MHSPSNNKDQRPTVTLFKLDQWEDIWKCRSRTTFTLPCNITTENEKTCPHALQFCFEFHPNQIEQLNMEEKTRNVHEES